MSNEIDLKPCPFCGGDNVGCYESWTHWACQCDDCGATMVKRGNKEEAIKAWNTRAKPTCEGCVIPERDYGHAPSPCNFCVRNNEKYDLHKPKVME